MAEAGRLVVVRGTHAGAGATTVAAALGFHLAYAGFPVRVARLATGPGGESGPAARDAAALAAIEALDAPLHPLTAADLAAEPAGPTWIVDAGTESPGALGGLAGAQVTLLVTDAPLDAEPVPTGTVPTGSTPTGGTHLVRTRVPAAATPGAAAVPWSLAEDRLLAAPTVATLIEATGARVLTRSLEGERAVCEHIVLGAIAADADRPHFARFPRKAVVTRAERVDVGLAAVAADTACLVLTGGHDPSPYLLDRVGAGRETTLLVVPGGTVETARALGDCFGRSPFSHEAKAERAAALLAATVDAATLAGLAGG